MVLWQSSVGRLTVSSGGIHSVAVTSAQNSADFEDWRVLLYRAVCMRIVGRVGTGSLVGGRNADSAQLPMAQQTERSPAQGTS